MEIQEVPSNLFCIWQWQIMVKVDLDCTMITEKATMPKKTKEKKTKRDICSLLNTFF